jgi:hypothetical protein
LLVAVASRFCARCGVLASLVVLLRIAYLTWYWQ